MRLSLNGAQCLHFVSVRGWTRSWKLCRIPSCTNYFCQPADSVSAVCEWSLQATKWTQEEHFFHENLHFPKWLHFPFWPLWHKLWGNIPWQEITISRVNSHLNATCSKYETSRVRATFEDTEVMFSVRGNVCVCLNWTVWQHLRLFKEII